MFRKPYEKPRVTKVRLEAKVSVLAVCKSATALNQPNFTGGYCDNPSNCLEISS